MKPLVSVLVPIYNTEKYLRQCLDSIVSQTYQHIEIICINNASTDNSLGIMQQYAQADARVKIIHKPQNKGYADSINLGLVAAQGSYISIVEADDWAAPNMIETLMAKALAYPQADIVRGDYYSYIPSIGEDKPVCNVPAHLVGRLIEPKTHPEVFKCDFAIWSAIYKKEFLQKNHIRLNDKPQHSFQDISFAIITWALAEYVYLISTPILHYRRDNAASSVHQTTHVFAVQEEFRYACQFLGDKAISFQAIINHLKLRCYWWNIKRIDVKQACEFITACAAEIAHMVRYEKIDWQGLSVQLRMRTYLWAISPKLLTLLWRGRKQK